MKRFIKVSAFFASLSLFAGLFGCEPEEPAVKETKFSVAEEEVKVKAEGGAVTVEYELVNPIEGEVVEASVPAECGWIKDLKAEEGKISFTTDANADQESRTAEVTVVYAEFSDKFTVVQDAAETEPEPENEYFDMSIDRQDGTAVYVSIVPKDKEMTYMYGCVPASELKVYPDDETFVEEYLFPYYENLAAEYEASVEELLDAFLVKGDQSGISMAGLSPDTDFYFFAVGMNNKMEILCDFEKIAFRTDPLPDFAAELDVVIDGPNVVASVFPEDESIGYYTVIFNGKGHANDVLLAAGQSSIENIVMSNMISGADRDVTVQLITRYGIYSAEYALMSESDYTFAAFLINEDGYIVSNPVIKEFTTEKTPMSKNEISFEFTKIGGRRVEFTVHTTVPEDPYVFFVFKNGEIAEEKTDDEIIAYICENINLSGYIRRGDVNSYATALREKSDYIIYAFGYSGGEVTTKLFKQEFSSIEAEYNESTFSYKFGPYYDGDQAAEKYPNSLANAKGKLVFPADYEVTGEWYGVWHGAAQGDVTDESMYDKEDIYERLRDFGGNTWINTHVLYVFEYDKVYTLCGFVETKDGNFSKLYRMAVGPFTKEGCSPIDEFNEADLTSLSAVAIPPYAIRGKYSVKPLNPVSENSEYAEAIAVGAEDVVNTETFSTTERIATPAIPVRSIK